MVPLDVVCRRDRAPRRECGSRLRGYTLRPTMLLPLRKDIESLRRGTGLTRAMGIKSGLHPSTISTITTAAMTVIRPRTLRRPRPNSLISTRWHRNSRGTRSTCICKPVHRSRRSVDQSWLSVCQVGILSLVRQNPSPTCATRKQPSSRWQETFPRSRLNSQASSRWACPMAHSPIRCDHLRRGSQGPLPAPVYLRVPLRIEPGCSLRLKPPRHRTVCPLILHRFAPDTCPARW